ncbi:MAG: type II toxin-antitoxin system HicB family antitoxin [Tannerella sp.]|nr:type II toxin-antitoxin system HicB family antitoxin [Tannerella sp.]
MNQIHVILESGKDGYGVMFREFDNIFGFGETVEAAKKDAVAVLSYYVELLKRNNKPMPELLTGQYELVYEFDVDALLKYIDGTVTKTALARASGINAAQLTHYSSGLKKPRRQQREKIISGLHRIAADLLAVT